MYNGPLRNIISFTLHLGKIVYLCTLVNSKSAVLWSLRVNADVYEMSMGFFLLKAMMKKTV